MDIIAIIFFTFSFVYMIVFFVLSNIFIKEKRGFGLFKYWKQIVKETSRFWKQLALFCILFFGISLVFVWLTLINLLFSIIFIVFVIFPTMFFLYWDLLFPTSTEVSQEAISDLEQNKS